MQASNWRVLALTVISEAITDMQEDNPSARKQAIDWLLHDSEDFPLICELAQLDPALVRQRVNFLRQDAAGATHSTRRTLFPPYCRFSCPGPGPINLPNRT
jgi:hypothetical protein